MTATAPTTTRRHRLGLAGILLVSATAFTDCSSESQDCDGSGTNFQDEAAAVRGAVKSAADELGIPSDGYKEEFFDAKDALGNDDPSARRLDVRAIGQSVEIPDFSRVVAMWKADWSLIQKHASLETRYFERTGIKAELGYSSEPGKDGMHNVWAEASTNCFPAAEVDES